MQTQQQAHTQQQADIQPNQNQIFTPYALQDFETQNKLTLPHPQGSGGNLETDPRPINETAGAPDVSQGSQAESDTAPQATLVAT